MRNKTEEFRKKYAPDSIRTVQPSPLKHKDTTFYRSTCNLARMPSQPRVPLRSERQLLGHQSTPAPLYGSTGSRRVLARKQSGPKPQEGKQISIKLAMVDMHETANTEISELKWRPAKGSSVVEQTGRSFIENLPKNKLFYCCKCYQYIFQIEKSRHFPECRDRLVFDNLEKDRILHICWERLQRIVGLSQYTSTRAREVEDLWQEVKNSDFNRMMLINYPEGVQFFLLQDILKAFVYTYEKLLKGRAREDSDFLKCF